MSNSDVEQRLQRLAEHWPGRSVSAEVVSRLPDRPVTPIARPRLELRLYSWIGVIATAVVFAASLWVSMPRSSPTALENESPISEAIVTTENDESVDGEVVEESEREPLSDQPSPLPESITGQVVDSDGNPVSGAMVTVRVRRFSLKTKFDENAGPGPWSATTDEQGVYTIAPTGSIVPRNDEVRISVFADGFAQMSAYDYEKKLLGGSLPTVKLSQGRMIVGRLVDTDGNRISKAVLRFQHNTEAVMDAWDSGPFPADRDGTFAVSVPIGGKAVGVAYPNGLAPRFIEVGELSDLGDVVVQPGARIKGRVLDQKGVGVAETVVGYRNSEYREMFAYMAVIGSAVKTDAEGNFQLPPLKGSYVLTVTDSAPDYSRQMMLIGTQPPEIEPITIDIDSADPEKLVLLRP